MILVILINPFQCITSIIFNVCHKFTFWGEPSKKGIYILEEEASRETLEVAIHLYCCFIEINYGLNNVKTICHTNNLYTVINALNVKELNNFNTSLMLKDFFLPYHCIKRDWMCI